MQALFPKLFLFSLLEKVFLSTLVHLSTFSLFYFTSSPALNPSTLIFCHSKKEKKSNTERQKQEPTGEQQGWSRRMLIEWEK